MLSQIEMDFLRESNAIEGVYDQKSLCNASFAWDYLRNLKRISSDDIQKIHGMIMVHFGLAEEHLGKFRNCGVTIGGRKGFPYGLIPTTMEDYCNRANEEKHGLDSARWDEIQKNHIFFERIHPFVDGNGRTGRMLMNWERLNSKLSILVIRESEKESYYGWF